MTEFRTVTEDFAVSPQIHPSDVVAAAARGFTLIINNRPDGEAPDQPSGSMIEAAARAAGLAYAYIPVSGRPTADQVEQVRAAAASTPGKALAFCRSGTRSIITWSLGQAAAGARDREDLVRLGAAAGYDLSNVLPG